MVKHSEPDCGFPQPSASIGRRTVPAGCRVIASDLMPPIRLNARERALVRLLAEGHTDATAALELHISPRSVTNILRGLMDQLGVDNRFQLGLALGALRIADAEPGDDPPDGVLPPRH